MNDLNQLTEIQRHWWAHIEAAQRSSLSLAAYARAQGLAPQTLYQWRNLFKQKGMLAASPQKAEAFAQVQVMTTMTDSADAPIRLDLGGGLSLECQQWPEPAWLARLVHLLDQDTSA